MYVDYDLVFSLLLVAVLVILVEKRNCLGEKITMICRVCKKGPKYINIYFFTRILKIRDYLYSRCKKLNYFKTAVTSYVNTFHINCIFNTKCRVCLLFSMYFTNVM